MPKEILLITNYFPPEKGAAANRMHTIAESLEKKGYLVHVVCPFPNYPNGKLFEGFKGSLFITKQVSFGKITRLWVWPSNSTNKILRLLSMLSFSFSLTLFLFFSKTPKKIFIQYSPVFVGFTAVCLGSLFLKKIILNVSDLWPQAGFEMGILKKGWYYTLLLKMEKFCYRKATLIIGQSDEILQHISTFEKEKPKFLYRNLPNLKTSEISTYEEVNEEVSKEVKIVYAGLLGIAQGINEICQQIKLPKHLSLHIYGAGPETEKIKAMKNKNIYFYGELDRDSLHKELQQYDIAFVPLVNRIYGSVPSKIFEYSRLGLPLLYFAGGEGGEIVTKNKIGWNIPVKDFKALQHFIDTLSESELKKFPKKIVQKNSEKAFNFNTQFDAFASKINKI